MRILPDMAKKLLRSGQVVAIPTETVYGLAASLTNLQAIEQIFTIKGRPSNNPLIIHLGYAHQLMTYVKELPRDFDALAQTFWPGPLTLVLPVEKASIPHQVRANLPTAAFRIPSHPMTRDLLMDIGPLVMPSANVSGSPSATRPEHVESDFGLNFPVLDGGMCQCGVESTILSFCASKWHIVRLGAIAQEMFAPILGYLPSIDVLREGQSPLCPGQLYRHYAPKARLQLASARCSKGVVIGFNERSYPDAKQLFLLGSLAYPEKIAENLYNILRQLDLEGIEEAFIDMDFPNHGLWITIRERLQRAAR